MAVAYYIAGVLLLLVAPVTLSHSCVANDRDGTCQESSAAALHQISFNRGKESQHMKASLDCSVCDVDFSTPEDSNAGLETFLTLPAGLKTKFKNACTVAGETLDMVLTTESNWTTKLKHDKVVGTMSQTNVKSGTSVAWDFQLVSAATGQPVVVDNVIFSVLDVDSGGAVFQQVKINGFSAIAAGAGICEAQPGVFESTTDGDESDNPTSTMELTAAQEDSVLSLNFKKVSGWKVTLSIPKDVKGGRNFFVGGATKLMTPAAVCANTLTSTSVTPCT